MFLTALTAALTVALAGCSQPQPPALATTPQQPAPPKIAQPPRLAPKVEPPPNREPAPQVTAVQLGRSLRGEPLVMYIIGQGPGVFIFGGIHGSEPSGVDVATGLIDYLVAHPEACRGRTVAILANANPDGIARGTRTNARKVDLNRNFPAGNWKRIVTGQYTTGSAAASEPETQAILEGIRRTQPGLIISLHSALPGNHCNNYDGPAAGIARAMAAQNGYPVKASIGYPTPGSLGSWAGIDRGIATITLELPGDIPGEECWEQNRQALLTAILAAPAASPTVGK